MTPRAPIHHGDFVDLPHHAGPNVPHWSRWEASATTFGPVGRIGWTLAIVWFVLNGILANPLMLLFVVPAGLTVIHAVWRQGWIVPGDTTTYHGIDRFRPAGGGQGLALRSRRAGTTVIAAAIAMGVSALVIYGDPVVKFCGIVASVVLFAFLFFRRFFGRL